MYNEELKTKFIRDYTQSIKHGQRRHHYLQLLFIG